jgi:hypothetical protein
MDRICCNFSKWQRKRTLEARSELSVPPWLQSMMTSNRSQILDLCCAIAMDEATAMRHRIPLREPEWDWVPHATRVALPEVAKQNAYQIPRSIATIDAQPEVRTAAIRDLVPLAREIVPRHGQAEAMYRWFETLTRLEAGGLLERVALADGVQKTLRAMPWAHKGMQKELQEHEGPYFDRHGDHGGWTQLKMIIDWTLFLRMWQLLDQKAADQREVVRALAAIGPDRSLRTLSEIRAFPGTS